jgi:hypothetical protein
VPEGKPSVLRVNEGQAAVVVKASQIAATGSTGWEFAIATGLAKTHASEVLTYPIYEAAFGRASQLAWLRSSTRRSGRRSRRSASGAGLERPAAS